MQKKFEFLPHTADIKFKAFGKTENELFENVLQAVISFIAKENHIQPKRGKMIKVNGSDKENLLYRFVEEILTIIDSEGFIPSRGKVTLLGNNLEAELFGDDAVKYEGLDHIKAPTYAEIYYKETKPVGWEAQMVLDV